MDKSTSLLIGAALFLVASLVNAFARRPHRGFADYFALPARIGPVVLALTILGTLVGGGIVVGLVEIGAKGGVVGAVLGLGYALAFLILASLAGRLRAMTVDIGVVSLFDLLDMRCPEQYRVPVLGVVVTVSRLFAAVYFASYFFILAAQVVVVSTFIQTFAPGLGHAKAVLTVGALLYALNTVLYTAWGGIEKDIRTDIFQMGLVAVFVVGLTTLSVVGTGGNVAALKTLPGEFFDGTGYGVAFLVVALLAPFPSLFVRLDLWQRIIAGQSVVALKRAFYLVALACVLVFSLFAFVGMYARANIPDVVQAPERAVYLLVDGSRNGWAGGMLLICLFAAVLSSADTFLNAASVSLSRVWFRREWALIPKWSIDSKTDSRAEKSLRRKVSFVTLGVGIVSVVLGVILGDVVALLIGALSALTVLFPVCLVVVLGKDVKVREAFWSVAMGLSVFLLVVFGFGMAEVAFLPAFLVSGAVFVAMRLFGRRAARSR